MMKNPVGDLSVRTSVAFGVIDTIAVALRLLARTRSKASLAADDALIIASLLPLYAMIVVGHSAVQSGGLGLTTAENMELGHGPSRISTFLKLIMSAMVTYTLTITIVKLSILVLYRRVFSTTAFRRGTLIVGAAVLAWSVVAIFTDLFQCRPFQAAFNPELLHTDQCINLQAYYRGITASNLGVDVVMLYMPLHMVWGLKLATRQKMALSGIFLLGLIVCIAAAMRIVTLGYMQHKDMTFTLAYAYIWSQVEPALAILCACLVTLRPLFVNLNLNSRVSKISSRFRRNKRQPPSKSTSSTSLSSRYGLQRQWPLAQELRQGDKRSGGQEMPIVTNIDRGTPDLDSRHTRF